MRHAEGTTRPPAPPGEQAREKRTVAAVSVGAAVLLTGTKLAVGLMTGSLGVLAEAAHSALDLVAALVTLFAVRISDRPADASHPYGHGKVENLSALVETLLLLLACAWIAREAVERLLHGGVEVDPNIWAFLVLGLSIVVDCTRSRALGRVAKKYGSQALEADALHFRTDVWSTAVVLAGLGLVRYGQLRGGGEAAYVQADAVAALVVAAVVVAAGVRLGRRAIDVLLDRAPAGLADRIYFAVAAMPDVSSVARVRARPVGNRVFVDLKVDVPRHLPFERTHELTEQIQGRIRAISPGADVVVHTVPAAAGGGILERIRAVAAREGAAIHNICAHRAGGGLWIDLDLEVSPDMSVERAHALAADFENRLRDALADEPDPVAGIGVHIEPRGGDDGLYEPVGASDAALYAERIERAVAEQPGARGCQNITAHASGGIVRLSFDLLVQAGIPVSDMHGIAEDVESRLRRECPELGRVVIHAEPVRG